MLETDWFSRDVNLALARCHRSNRAVILRQKKNPQALVDSRRARLAELKGNPREALELMRRAAQEEGRLDIHHVR